jgi:hypothetical protein
MKSYKAECDVNNKICQYQEICGTTKRTLKQVIKEAKLKCFKAMAIPTLLCGSET